MSDEYKNDFNDPDFLAVVARDLLNEIDSSRKSSLPQDSSKDPEVLRRQVSVLDSLANLCVYKSRGQVVAVAAVLHPNHTSILVAENGPVSEPLLRHLRDVFGRLKIIREAYAALPLTSQGEPVSPIHLFIDVPKSPFELALVNLEVAILRFSWDKFRLRLTKNHRHTNFALVVADICGVAAEKRDDLPAVQRETLAELQASPHLDRKNLNSAAVDVGNMLKVLDMNHEDSHVLALRALLAKVAIFYQGVAEHGELFASWNSFLKYRVLNPDSGIPGTVKKELDTLRWLKKIISIREHARRVARLATSHTLADMLRDVKVTAVHNKINPKLIKMNEKTVQDVLVASKCEMNQEGGKTAGDYLKKLTITASAFQPDKENLYFEFRKPRSVHCECALLAALHGLPAIPYIGVSKLSCGFCQIYFDAYRAVTNSTTMTQGSHDLATAWRAPTVADSATNDQIRLHLATKLNASIRNGWSKYNRSSLDSQSTATSGEIEPEDPDHVRKVNQNWEKYRALLNLV
ncbi:hypothetical protein C8J57DRAFT_1268628 [Mycena rebaudengoi]|nr:hypothetical protein C8J57DRAFT_1268628 [Mycena rebaudengoi]